ncbi:Protein of unknown function [Pyronema omphalodes CBS 100304]|uniref:Uncharacterized protein n=1 Tax=Pyronema omphalodes (strain CBS 100304) TaxID=1076935 RepID=U4KYP0_PYROM|nr:Protein of unknown function [Pyronema omphalodes CBS 100304]
MYKIFLQRLPHVVLLLSTDRTVGEDLLSGLAVLLGLLLAGDTVEGCLLLDVQGDACIRQLQHINSSSSSVVQTTIKRTPSNPSLRNVHLLALQPLSKDRLIPSVVKVLKDTLCRLLWREAHLNNSILNRLSSNLSSKRRKLLHRSLNEVRSSGMFPLGLSDLLLPRQSSSLPVIPLRNLLQPTPVVSFRIPQFPKSFKVDKLAVYSGRLFLLCEKGRIRKISTLRYFLGCRGSAGGSLKKLGDASEFRVGGGFGGFGRFLGGLGSPVEAEEGSSSQGNPGRWDEHAEGGEGGHGRGS